MGKPLLIALLSDTHLGFRFGHRLSPAGYNQREADFEQALVEVVNELVSAQPRLVIHGGDCFHHFNPTDRARTFFIRQLKRLLAGLPNTAVVLLRGNHDTSRLLRDGSALATTAEALPEPRPARVSGLAKDVITLDTGLYVVDDFAPASIVVEDVLIHAVSWARNDGEFKQAIDAAGRLARPEHVRHMLLALHAGLAELPEFERLVVGSQTLTLSELPDNFDHIFSGHFHGHWRADKKRFTFIGSTERTSANQIDQAKGWLSYDSATGQLEQHIIKLRPWHDLGDIDVGGLDGQAITSRLESLLRPLGELAEAMVRLRLINIDRDVYATLDRAAVAAIAGRAMHFDLRYRPADPSRAEVAADGGLALRELDDEWHDFIERALASRPAPEREAIAQIGRQALSGELRQSAD